MLYDLSPVFLSSNAETPHVIMRGVEMYVAPLVVQLRIPTLLPPEELTLGLEYLISLSGLKISPEIISLGALDALVVEEDLKEDGLLVWVAEDIVYSLVC
jgi:hypothetical protein